MKETILRILKELTAINSRTDTKEEIRATNYIYDRIRQEMYFQEHPDFVDRYAIENDYLKRDVVYAFVKGKTNRTVIFMGHVDVVGVEDYGSIKEYAFDIEKLPAKLEKVELYREAKRDLDSKEWIFGRGTADMKGGVSAVLAYFLEFSKEESRDGNLLFLAVPDEESYSVGMRGAVSLLKELKETYQFDYRLLIDPEPNFRVQNKQIMSIGSVGKCMPAVLVQGATAHICKCFDGLNPLGVMSEILLKTELSLEFCDRYEKEITAPPTWLSMKDRKEGYDVSLPLRAGGYLNLLSFTTTPDEILMKLSKIAWEACQRYIQKVNSTYEIYSGFSDASLVQNAGFQPKVMTVRELTDMLGKERKEEYHTFYQKLYASVLSKIRGGELNYPEATIYMMSELLTFSGILTPVILLGFAPPYYPPVHSDKLEQKEGMGSAIFEVIKKCAKEKLQIDFAKENYMLGISDLSYCGIGSPFDFNEYVRNTPVWGEMYHMDFDSIKEINIPGIILGPWGKDLHQITERVNKKSLLEEFPLLLDAAVKECFK